MEPRQKRILTILFVGVLMAALDIAIVGPALPAIQADFGIDSREMAWIFNIYVLFNLIGTPIMAKASDRFGRRAVYVTDIALFAAGSLILVLAPSFGVLLVGRAVQGLGAGGVFPVASAVIGDTLPREQRGRALGLIGAVFGLAFLVGPILGGILLRLSWHWLFLINLPIAVALIWQAWRWLPASRAPQTAPFDVAGAVVLTALLTALTVAITEFDSVGRASGLGSALVALLGIGVVLLLAVLMAVERRAADPIVRPALLKTRQMRLVGAIAIGTGVAESAAVFFPAMAVLALSLSEADASLLMLPLVLAMTLAAPAAGWLLDRLGSRPIITFGLALVAAGLLMFSLSTLTFLIFIAGGILGGIGLAALLGAPLRYVVLNEAGTRDRGAAQGLLTVCLSTGQLVGAAIVGGVAASLGSSLAGYQQSLLPVGLLAVALAIASLGLKSRQAELEGRSEDQQAPSAAG